MRPWYEDDDELEPELGEELDGEEELGRGRRVGGFPRGGGRRSAPVVRRAPSRPVVRPQVLRYASKRPPFVPPGVGRAFGGWRPPGGRGPLPGGRFPPWRPGQPPWGSGPPGARPWPPRRRWPWPPVPGYWPVVAPQPFQAEPPAAAEPEPEPEPGAPEEPVGEPPPEGEPVEGAPPEGGGEPADAAPPEEGADAAGAAQGEVGATRLGGVQVSWRQVRLTGFPLPHALVRTLPAGGGVYVVQRDGAPLSAGASRSVRAAIQGILDGAYRLGLIDPGALARPVTLWVGLLRPDTAGARRAAAAALLRSLQQSGAGASLRGAAAPATRRTGGWGGR